MKFQSEHMASVGDELETLGELDNGRSIIVVDVVRGWEIVMVSDKSSRPASTNFRFAGAFLIFSFLTIIFSTKSTYDINSFASSASKP